MTMIKVDPFRSFDTVVRRMGDVFDDIQRGGIRFEVGSSARELMCPTTLTALQSTPSFPEWKRTT
ncbi:MAG: hypothetical protein IPM83_02390 [Ignavibacteria bacterium]|nr:hypothetical protein [Ignavibacteria bacterium]